MNHTIIVTERDKLEEAVARAVRDAILETVPTALRVAAASEWMSRDEVCNCYGLTPRQLTYMRDKRRVEFTQHRRRILYNRASLEAWIEAGRVRGGHEDG